MQAFINRLIPFILLGIAFVALVFGIILLAYLFFFGAIVGFILFIIQWVRNKYLPPKHPISKKPGRTFDSDKWNVL